MNIAAYIDHTILKPSTTIAEIEQLCKDAAAWDFAAVCVPPPFVKSAKILLDPTRVKVATVTGFPFGYSATEAKIAETVLALVDGADEIDMVINLVALRMGDYEFLRRELKLATEVVHNKDRTIKIIIESGILSDDEIVLCCGIAAEAGVDYVKTSTGYAERGATLEAVQLMRRHLPETIKIKASGGIKSFTFAEQLILAGASRLGCSAGVQLMEEQAAR